MDYERFDKWMGENPQATGWLEWIMYPVMDHYATARIPTAIDMLTQMTHCQSSTSRTTTPTPNDSASCGGPFRCLNVDDGAYALVFLQSLVRRRKASRSATCSSRASSRARARSWSRPHCSRWPVHRSLPRCYLVRPDI